MTAKRINQAQLARLCGVSRPTINKLVAKRIVTLDDDGLIDPAEAVAAIAAHADQSQAAARDTIAARIAAGKITVDGAPVPPPAAPTEPAAESPSEPASQPADDTPAHGAEITSFQLARALREKFAALNERLEYETRLGKMIERDVVERNVFGLARAAQESLRAIPDRLAPLLAAESDPHACHTLLSTEIRAVIEQIANTRPLPPPPEAAAA